MSYSIRFPNSVCIFIYSYIFFFEYDNKAVKEFSLFEIFALKLLNLHYPPFILFHEEHPLCAKFYKYICINSLVSP